MLEFGILCEVLSLLRIHLEIGQRHKGLHFNVTQILQILLIGGYLLVDLLYLQGILLVLRDEFLEVLLNIQKMLELLDHQGDS